MQPTHRPWKVEASGLEKVSLSGDIHPTYAAGSVELAVVGDLAAAERTAAIEERFQLSHGLMRRVAMVFGEIAPSAEQINSDQNRLTAEKQKCA